MAAALHAIHQESCDVSALPRRGSVGPRKNFQSLGSGESQDDRVRSVFGVRDGGSLPRVSRATLLAYYKYLRARLSMPFRAEHCSVHSRIAEQVTVIDLVSPAGVGVDIRRGLMCVARGRDGVRRLPLVELEVREDEPSFHLLEDYWYWAWNWGIEHP
jgi:hypothetical protein